MFNRNTMAGDCVRIEILGSCAGCVGSLGEAQQKHSSSVGVFP